MPLSNLTFAIEKSIYGEDNRQDINQYYSEIYQNIGKSVGAMIHDYFIYEGFDNDTQEKFYSIDSNYTLSDNGHRSVCRDEKFAPQKVAAECTGFLIGPKTLITASHCVETKFHCENYKWVFDYNEGQDKISQDAVYSCSRVIKKLSDEENFNYDVAVIELDREVVGRDPLTLSKNYQTQNLDELIIIGHPSGLPKKIADKGIVRYDINEFKFKAELDSFTGNSGSPVFDKKSGLVIGMLTQGERDYEFDVENNCLRPIVCQEGECAGETVMKSDAIEGLLDGTQRVFTAFF